MPISRYMIRLTKGHKLARNISLPIIASGAVDLKSISEYDFQVAITRYAEQNDWTVQYFRKTAAQGKDGRWRAIAPPGWPDIFCWRGKKAIAAEIKAEGGYASPEQKAKIASLGLIEGVTTYIWKPRDAAEIIGALQ